MNNLPDYQRRLYEVAKQLKHFLPNIIISGGFHRKHGKLSPKVPVTVSGRSWTHYQTNHQTYEAMKAQPFTEALGIGYVSRDGFVTLDFDQVENGSIVSEALRMLGLDKYYEWLIKTGSGKGYHVIIRTDADATPFNQTNTNHQPKACTVHWTTEDDTRCDHLEFRRNVFNVLPPTIRDNGNAYRFYYDRLPEQSPMFIPLDKVEAMICKLFPLHTKDKAKTRDIKPAKKSDLFSKQKPGPSGKGSIADALKTTSFDREAIEDFISRNWENGHEKNHSSKPKEKGRDTYGISGGSGTITLTHQPFSKGYCWKIWAHDINGSGLVSLVSYVKYGTTAPEGKAFIECLAIALEYCGYDAESFGIEIVRKEAANV